MSAAQPASDVYLSDFYRDQSDYSAPGQLLRVEPLSEKQSLAAAEENFRVLYSSTEGIWGNDLVASIRGALPAERRCTSIGLAIGVMVTRDSWHQ